MNTNTVAQSVNKVLNKVLNKKQATFTPCTLTINTETLEYAELLEKIKNFQAQQGWVAYQSENRAFKTKEEVCTEMAKTGGVVSSNNPDKGKILSAELSNQAQSISIRHLQENQWQISTYTKDETGDTHLCDTVTHHATSGLGKLCYQRIWKKTEQQGFEPYASYFTGFEEKQIETNEKEENNHAH